MKTVNAYYYLTSRVIGLGETSCVDPECRLIPFICVAVGKHTSMEKQFIVKFYRSTLTKVNRLFCLFQFSGVEH